MMMLVSLTIPFAQVLRSSHNIFSIHKRDGHFYIRHNLSKREVFLGNGHGVIFDDHNQEVLPTDDRLVALWEEDVNSHVDDVMEDFFS